MIKMLTKQMLVEIKMLALANCHKTGIQSDVIVEGRKSYANSADEIISIIYRRGMKVCGKGCGL